MGLLFSNCWPYCICEHLKSSKWHSSAHRLQAEVNYMPGARDRVIAGLQNALQSDHTYQLFVFSSFLPKTELISYFL